MVLPFNVALYSGVSVAALFAAAGADAYAIGGNSPEFVADFAGTLNSGTEYYRSGGSDTDFASVFTFSRPTTATYVNSSGVLTTASSGVARRNHHIWNGSAWVNAGILIEPAAATNLISQSNNFSTTWTIQNTNSVTLTSAASTGPDGSASMTELEITDATSEVHGIRYPVTDSASTTCTFSVYAKNGTQRYIQLLWIGATTAWASVVFDLQTGTVTDTQTDLGGGGTIIGSGIESIGGSIYRCHFSASLNSVGTSIPLRINFVSSGTPTLGGTSGEEAYAGTAGVNLFIYGAQFEVGSVPTSYIPTSGSTVTRAAETLTVAGASLPANTTGMSVQMQGRMSYADLGSEAQRTFWRWYNGASDFLTCDLDTDGADTGEVNANQSDTTGGAGTVAIDAYSPGINVAYNIASRHSNTDINLAVDGTAGTADTTPTALHDASSDTFQVAHNLQGSVGMLRIWGTGLSDTDLESAT